MGLQDFGSDPSAFLEPLHHIGVVAVLSPLRQARVRAEMVAHRRLEHLDELAEAVRARRTPVAPTLRWAAEVLGLPFLEALRYEHVLAL